MKIGMMTDTYKPHVSGITNYIDLNKRALEQAGHDVFVFTFGDMDYDDNDPCVTRSRGLPLADTGYFLSLRYSRVAKKLLQTMDVVHVHHPFLSGRLALHYCRPLQIPIVFTNHTRYDLYAQAYLPMMPEEVSQSLLQAYMPSFCDAVDLVIAPSAGMEKILRKLNVQSRVEVVPNGVDLKRFYQAEPLSRAEFGFSNNDILLIYAGRLAVEKNLPFLLQSFAGVAQAIPNIHLLLIGGGLKQFEEEMRSLVSELELNQHVHFTGIINYDNLPGYLAMCDAFVTASVTEVHPLSVIEAMGSGLPVMGIQSVGVGDTVEDGVTGFLSTHNLPAFTAKLTRLCLDPDLRAHMKYSAQMASTVYAIERTTKAMLQHYEKMVYDSQPREDNWAERLRGLLKRTWNDQSQ
jgi:1,2-diacylglycerol 3-alpha-glucosyltransferase